MRRPFKNSIYFLKKAGIYFSCFLPVLIFCQCKPGKDTRLFRQAVFIDSLPPHLDPSRLKDIYIGKGSSKERMDTLRRIDKIIGKYPSNDTTAMLKYYIGAMYYDTKQYEKAIPYIQEAIAIDSSVYHFYRVYGLSLMELLPSANREKSDLYFHEAWTEFEKAKRISSASKRAISTIHEHMGDLYKTMADHHKPYRLEYYPKAMEYYESVLPYYASDILNFKKITVLSCWAKEAEGGEKQRLYEQASELLARTPEESSHKLQPVYINYNWGGNLLLLGDVAPEEKKDSLYQLASLKFPEAIDLYKERHREGLITDEFLKEKLKNSYMYLHYTYTKRSLLKTGKEADDLFHVGCMYAKKAIQLGDSGYNQACAYALGGDVATAFKMLNQILKKKRMSFDFIEGDEDWDALRNHPEYVKLRKKYKH